MKMPSFTWRIKGTAGDGPTVVVLGGTHGDEMTGIELVRRMLAALGLSEQTSGITVERNDLCGTLILGFGNPEAIRLHRRGVDNQLNLNRSFTSKELDAAPLDTDREDLRRARELAPLLATCDFLFDIHATSSPSPPFVCFGNDTPRHRELYRLIPIDTILTDPDTVLMKPSGLQELGTTDALVNRSGGTGLCYETGLETDLTCVDRTRSVVARLLRHVGVATPAFLATISAQPWSEKARKQRVYKLTTCVVAKEASFQFVPSLSTGWQRVKQGDVIGTYASGATETSPVNGMILFQKGEAKVTIGMSLYFVAEEIAHISAL